MAKKEKPHVHTRTGEGMIWWVPADPTRAPEFKATSFDLDSLSSFVGGYIEVVRTPHLPTLECGCGMVMVVNEEGLLRALPPNRFGSIFYPGTIAGDIFLVAEGPVENPGDEYGEPDFFGLPPAFNTWDKFIQSLAG